MNINLISNKYVKTVIPSILTNFTAADAHRVTSAPTVNRQSTDSQTQRHYTLTTRLTRLAALFLMLLTLGVGQMWGTRLFQTGQKVYFQDATLTNTMSGNRWKSGTNGNVYAYFFNQKDHVGDDVTNWAEGAGKLVYGTDGAANAIYEFTVPSLPSGGDGVWWGVIFTRGTAASWDGRWNQTTNQYPADEKSLFTIADNTDGSNWTGSWSVMPEMIGTMSSPTWSKEDGWFFTGYSGEKGIIKITCTAGQEISFKIFDGTYYGHWENNNSFSGLSDYGPKTEGGGENFNFKADEAGEYIFQWDKTNHKLWVWEPKARLAKQKYVYFDARNLKGSGTDYWQYSDFTARFWFKYYDSGSDKGSVDCTKASALEDWVYYALVPDDDYLGRIQMNKMNGESVACEAGLVYAKDRESLTQNCLKEESGKENWCTSWTPQWDTYCPPTTSETFTDNGTSTISWQPNTNDGTTSAKAIWVKTGTTLKVTANASKAVADPNMTIKYDFKVDGSSQQNTTTATYTHSASTNNTTYELSADIYTNYNLDNTKNSTKHTQSSIFYKALNTYSVTHTLSGVTKASGRSGDDAAAYYVAYDATYEANAGYYLPSDVTVTIGGVTKTKGTDYTWTVTDGTSGALAILTDKISGNVVVTINGIWRWSVAGSWKVITPGEGDPYWDPDTYAMGTISKVSSDDVCSVEVTLSANTNYTFKIADRAANPYEYWGNNTSTFYMTYGNSSNWIFGNDASNTAACGLTTAGAGTYTFTYNITQHKVSVTYPESFQVTAAGNPAAGGTVTPSSATYMSTSVGGEITATPNYSHYFNGWTSSAGGTFTSASSATTTFKPASAAATVTAAFPERTAFIEGNFQIYNSTRATRTKTGDSWQDASTTIKMTYDAGNNRYYLHTYSTPAELAAQLNSADAYFYVKTSTSSSSIANDATYKAYASAYQSLATYGSSNKKPTGSSENSFKFTGSEDGYVIIYFDGTHVWYELECALSYYGGDGATGDAPAARTYYAYGSNQTAASNTYSKTGYSFDHWDTVADDSGTDYAAGATNVAMNAREVCLHAQWEANSYTAYLDDMGADSHGTENVSVTYNATTNLTSAITKPTKAHYDFGGYYTSEDAGETLVTQLIDANGNWKKSVSGYTGASGDNPTWVHAGDLDLYAKWTEHEYSITMEVSPAGTGTTSPASTATGKLVTESGNITATPAAGYKFKEWQFSKTDENYDAWCADGYSSTDATIHIKAQHNGTLTAVFEERYSLVGSLQDDSGEGGMPGWVDYTKTFTVNSSSPVDLTRTCTLQANKTYKLQVHDLATSTNLGRSGCDPVCVLEENASLVMENSNNDVFLYTSGAGEYIFKITAIDGSNHPTLTVLRPYPVNFGQKYEDIDGTLHTGTTGGTAAATAGSALSSGDYVTYNTSVSHTATPASGYTFAGWWSSDAFEGNAFSNTNPMTYAVTSGDNTYAKFVETSTSVTLSNDGHGKVQIGGEDATSTTCGVTTTRSLTAVPDAGYKFKNWTTSSSPDFEVDDDDAAEVTLTGHGDGTAGTLTANFVERYSIKGTMNGENWSTTHTLTNIGTNAGSKDTCYVTMTLPANTTYEFAIYDEQTGGWYKAGTDAVYDMTYTNHTNWEFGDTRTYNCGITTAGKGTYKFIFNITDKTVTVVYPTSYQVNYGASVGGCVTSVEDGDENAVPNGGYVVAGGSVTYTAAANDGYTFVGWCGNDSYGNTFTDLNPWTNSSITATSNAYAKFKSTNFVIYRSGDKDDDPRAALDDVESYAGGTISETIEFRMKVRDLDMWHTLCLPFTVSAVKVWDEVDGPAYYDIVPYYRSSGTFYTGHYIIRTPEKTTDLSLAEFGKWNDPESPTGYKPSKDTPYIIQWHDSYFSGKYISFFGAADQTIPSFSAGSAPSSDNVVNVCVNKSMQTGSVAGAYMLESDYGNGAWLRLDNASEERDIPPFECYLLVNNPTRARYMAIRPGMTVADTPTGWDDVVNSETKTHIVVYSISGICVTQYNDCSINEAGQRLSESYGEGLYILRTDNESVKLMVGGK